jgi:hypothetical protein
VRFDVGPAVPVTVAESFKGRASFCHWNERPVPVATTASEVLAPWSFTTEAGGGDWRPRRAGTKPLEMEKLWKRF